ncbi:hypothetical protein B0H13DRAFT_1857082 [Mycena leptocephala]|nr:hypothetical protein B0H13DRAFT_1857082 [Mycena leptocephala]
MASSLWNNIPLRNYYSSVISSVGNASRWRSLLALEWSRHPLSDNGRVSSFNCACFVDTYIHTRKWGLAKKDYLGAELNPFLVGNSRRMNDGDTARFQTHMLSSDVPDSLQIGPNIIHASVALRVLAPKLTKAQLLIIGGVHNKPRMSSHELKTALENHRCNCPPSVTVFRYATRQEKTAEQTIRRTSRRDRARAQEQVKYS